MANQGSIRPGTDLFGHQQTDTSTGEQLLKELAAGYGPQAAQAQIQFNLGQEQLGQINQQLPNTLAYNQAMAGYQQGGLGISREQIGLQQLGLGQQAQQAATQQGFEQQQYGIQQGQYPEQFAEAQLAYQNALMNTQGQQAISGTQNTVGGKQQISTLGQQYGFQQQDIARAQALSQLGQKSELSGYQYSQEQLQNAAKNLQLNAQANGLSQQQLLTMLQYGQQQTALGAQQQGEQVLAGQAQDIIGLLSNAGPALSQAGFASNLNALAGLG